MCKQSVSSVVSKAHHHKEWMPFQSTLPLVANVTSIFFFLNDNTKSRTVSSVYSYIQKMNHCEAITLARYYTKKRIGTICLYDHSQSCVHTVKGLKAWYRLLAEVKCIFKMFVVQKVCFGCGVHNHVHGTGHTRHVKPVHST